MRVVIDSDRCNGAGMCNLTAPEIFMIDQDSGLAFVESELVDGAHEEDAVAGAVSCPQRAIALLHGSGS